MEYHNPVLLHPSVDALVTNPSGTYVDVTFGGGGHSRAILEKLSPEGRLVAFDQDEESQADLIDDPRFQFVPSNFKNLTRFCNTTRPGPWMASWPTWASLPIRLTRPNAASLTARRAVWICG